MYVFYLFVILLEELIASMYWRDKMQNIWKFMYIIVISALCLSPQTQSLILLPEQQRVTVGESFNLNLPLNKHLHEAISVRVKQNGSKQEKARLSIFSPDFLVDELLNQPGKIRLDLRLFNIIPLKQINIEVVAENKVYPGGHSIGILLPSSGVVVTGYKPILNKKGQKLSPAKIMGVRPGDIITAINGERVLNDKHAAELISAHSEKGAKLRILRGKKELTIIIKGEKCSQTKEYRIGLLIKNSISGIGTLTFFNPATLVFGALGHIVPEEGLNNLNANGGRIVMAEIHGIQPGKKGNPGEKIGFFIDEKQPTGTILNNTQYGIFGFLDKPMIGGNIGPLPVAFADQVKPGKAEMLTVIREDIIQSFNITIERVFPQKNPDKKGMIIRIDDPKLLAITGGIIQGMSGSPIIQNGRLVGAVTHVFVNDPTRGYGVLAEWMLLEAESLILQRGA
jgi:stage IV sporulation protein B